MRGWKIVSMIAVAAALSATAACERKPAKQAAESTAPVEGAAPTTSEAATPEAAEQAAPTTSTEKAKK